MGFALGLAAADAPRAKTDESPSIKRKMDDVAEAVAAVKRDLSGEKSPSIDWLITGMPRVDAEDMQRELAGMVYGQ